MSAIAGTATDPRAEKERLAPADMALAKRVVLRRADLGIGWRAVSAPKDDEEEALSCPGFDPDFSAFTITGKAVTAFAHASGRGSLFSLVELYPSREQASGALQTGANPAVAGCLRRATEEKLRAGRKKALFPTRVVFSRMLPAPTIGERAAAYRVVVRVKANGESVPVYLDVLVFQQGRSLGALIAFGVSEPVPARSQLAAKMVARMR